MKRIKKVSQTVPTYGQIVDGYSDSTTDSYSANYQNNHNIIVNPTTPTTNERVWFKHSRNIASDTTLKNGLWTSASGISTNASGWYVIESIKPNTTYTITKKNTTGTIVVNATATKPANGVSTSNRQNVSGSTKVNFTTNATDKYLFIGLFAGSPTEIQKTECIEELQVVEGNEEIPYEPYIETPSINVDGDEIYNQNISNYSTKETKIGTWIDGKPLYRKVIESTTFTTKFYPVSSDIKQFINQYGYVQRKDYTSIWQFIPSRVGNALGISFLNSTQDGGVQIDWGSSWQSDYANIFNKIVLIVEYTKTTD